jgi:hypothetical protein
MGQSAALTIYVSLAERRAALMGSKVDGGTTVLDAISHALTKRYFSAGDHNREMGHRLQVRLGHDRHAIQNAYSATISRQVSRLVKRPHMGRQ